MQIKSISVGKPEIVMWQNKETLTSIFKKPVSGPVQLHQSHLEGDEASDKSVHGTVDKAVYAFSAEAYDWWRKNSRFQPMKDCSEYGENLTVAGLNEKEIFVGDIYAVGSTQIQATGPRIPCFKIGIKFGHIGMVSEFLASPCPGVYFQTVLPGFMNAGDKLELVSRTQSEVSIITLFEIYRARKVSNELAEKVLSCPALPQAWHKKIAQFRHA